MTREPERDAYTVLIILALYSLAPLFSPNAFSQQLPVSDQPSAKTTSKRDEFIKIYYASDYRKAAAIGPTLITTGPDDHEIRFMLANSFAWTGQLEEAILHYQSLKGTAFEARANVGLANVYRWSGLPGLSAPLYRQVMVVDSTNQDALEGMAYAMRELGPQTAVHALRWTDSLETVREGMYLSHRWADETLQHRFEFEAGFLEDRRDALRVNQRDIIFRYAGMANVWKPYVEIAAQQSPTTKLFGYASVKLPGTPVTIGAGHMNWGKMAFDPNALREGLTANHFRIEANTQLAVGRLRGSYSGFRVSDRNIIHDAAINFAPAWQPVKIKGVKFFTGLEARKARFNTPIYWSPADGNYLALLGIEGEWMDRRWERFFVVQYGFPLGGEAERSYSAYGSIKRWIGESWAIGIRVSSQRTQRTGAYRANTAMLTVQALW